MTSFSSPTVLSPSSMMERQEDFFTFLSRKQQSNQSTHSYHKWMDFSSEGYSDESEECGEARESNSFGKNSPLYVQKSLKIPCRSLSLISFKYPYIPLESKVISLWNCDSKDTENSVSLVVEEIDDKIQWEISFCSPSFSETQKRDNLFSFSIFPSMVDLIEFFNFNRHGILRFHLRHPPKFSEISLKSANPKWPSRSVGPIDSFIDHRMEQSFKYQIDFDDLHSLGKLTKFLSSPHLRMKIHPFCPPPLEVSHHPIMGWSGGKDDLFNRVSFSLRYLIHVLLSHQKLQWTCHEKIVQLADAMKSSNPSAVNRMISILTSCILSPTEAITSEDQLVSRLLSPVIPSLSESPSFSDVSRNVFITPQRILPLLPRHNDSDSNRIIRLYSQFSDRFLRVTFMDEDQSPLTGNFLTENIVNHRTQRILKEGVNVGGRVFHFLAYSNSQLREQSAWFYCETKDEKEDEEKIPSANDIRSSIGDLSSIPIAAKKAARMGQAFSSTTQTIDVPDERVKVIEDTWDSSHTYCFSDGCGYISRQFAEKVMSVYDKESTIIPSAFQIRFRGAKGVVSIIPPNLEEKLLEGKFDLVLRRSMVKFEGNKDHKNIEVVNVSASLPLYLNREIIPLLEIMGVSKESILHVLNEQIEVFKKATVRVDSALDFMKTHGRDHHSVIEILSALKSKDPNILLSTEPFVFSFVRSVVREALMEMQYKFRIPVSPGGIRLMGIVDETNEIPRGFVFFQSSSMNISLQHGQAIAVGRDPSMHPGDIRLLKYYDPSWLNDDSSPPSSLKFLYDTVVFSTKGIRPETTKMSGGDLDGDLYFVIWDHRLLPNVDFPAMEYLPSASQSVTKFSSSNTKESVDLIANFFIHYMQNSSIPSIANAHATWCDKKGPKDPFCLELASLHSTAVDFAKSSEIAKLPKHLKPFEFPHWMNKRYNSFRSQSTLGIVFDKIAQIASEIGESESYSLVNQARSLDRHFIVKGYEDYEIEAIRLFESYAWDMWELMNSHGISSESDLLSGYFISEWKFRSKRWDHSSETTRLMKNIKRVHNKYESLFWKGLQKSSPLRLSKASAWYKVAYSETRIATMSFLNFAWIAVEPMCHIIKMKGNLSLSTSISIDRQFSLPSSFHKISLLAKEGQSHLRSHEFSLSLNCLEQAMVQFSSVPLESLPLDAVESLRLSIFLMMAQCHDGQGDFPQSVSFCKEVMSGRDSSLHATAFNLLNSVEKRCLPENVVQKPYEEYHQIDLTISVIMQVIYILYGFSFPMTSLDGECLLNTQISEGTLSKMSNEQKKEKETILLRRLQSLPLTRRIQSIRDIILIRGNRDLREWMNSIKDPSNRRLCVIVLKSGRYVLNSIFTQDTIMMGVDAVGTIIEGRSSHCSSNIFGSLTLLNLSFRGPPNPQYSAICCYMQSEIPCGYMWDKLKETTPSITLINCFIENYNEVGLLVEGIDVISVVIRCKFLNTSRQCIEVRGGASIYIEKCEFIGSGAQSISAYGGVKYVVIVDSLISKCGREGILCAGSDPNGRTSNDPFYSKLSPEDQRRLSAKALGYPDGMKLTESVKNQFLNKEIPLELCVSNCVIQGTTLYSISLDFSIIYASIFGCTFRNNKACSIYMKGGVVARISACHFFYKKSNGIQIGANYDASVHIRHNEFIGIREWGIFEESVLSELIPTHMYSKAPIKESNRFLGEQKSNENNVNVNTSITSQTDLRQRCLTLHRLRDRAIQSHPAVEDIVQIPRRVLRHDINSSYYTIGNTLGFNVARSLQNIKGLGRIDILLAQTRDIREILKTSTHLNDLCKAHEDEFEKETKSHTPCDTPMTIICQEDSVSLLSRIVLLLSLIEDESVPLSTIVSIWSNLSLSKDEHEILFEKLRYLNSCQSFPHWLFVSDIPLLSSIRQTFQEWLTCSVSLEKEKKTRRARAKKICKPQLMQEFIKESLPSSFQQNKGIQTDVENYLQEGSLRQLSNPLLNHLNVTMMEAPEFQASMYYSSAIFRAVDLDGDERRNENAKNERRGYLFHCICNALENQIRSTREWLSNPNHSVGIINKSIHSLVFEIPKFHSTHTDGLSYSLPGFDFIDFSNFMDYDSVAAILYLAKCLMKGDRHCRFFLHSLKFQRPNGISNSVLIDSFFEYSMGLARDLLSSILGFSVVECSTRQTGGRCFRMEMQIQRDRKSSSGCSKSMLFEFIDFISDRFLSINWTKEVDLLWMNGLHGMGTVGVFRTFQMACQSNEFVGILKEYLRKPKIPKSFQLHQMEIRSLLFLHEFSSSKSIEFDDSLLLMTFQPNIALLIYQRCSECCLQLVITEYPIEMNFRSSKFERDIPSQDVVALFDCLSFDKNTYEVRFLIMEKDLKNIQSYYFTLCAINDSPSIEFNESKSRIQVLASSIQASNINQSEYFAIRRILNPLAHMILMDEEQALLSSMISVSPVWQRFQSKGNQSFQKGLFDDAIEHYNDGIKYDDNILLRVTLHLALCFFELKKWKYSLKFFLASLSIDDSIGLVWRGISECFKEMMKSEEEKETFSMSESMEFHGKLLANKGNQNITAHKIFSLYPSFSNALPNGKPQSQLNQNSNNTLSNCILRACTLALGEVTPPTTFLKDKDHSVLQIIDEGIGSSKSLNFSSSCEHFLNALTLLKSRCVLFSDRSRCHSSLSGADHIIRCLTDSFASTSVDQSCRKGFLYQAVAFFQMDEMKSALFALDESMKSSLTPIDVMEVESYRRRFIFSKRLLQSSVLEQEAKYPFEVSSIGIIDKANKMFHTLAINQSIPTYEVPELNEEMKSQFPIQCDRTVCDTHLNYAMSHAKAKMLTRRLVECEQPNEKSWESSFYKQLSTRIGHPSRLSWWISSNIGDVNWIQENTEISQPFDPRPLFYSFPNQVVFADFLTLGTTHISIGAQHCDLTSLLTAKMIPSTKPLKFIGIGPNPICVAKSLLIAHILSPRFGKYKYGKPLCVECVLELWYSATLSVISLQIIGNAIHDLISQHMAEEKKFHEEVISHLQHWQSSHIPLSVARAEWRKGSHHLWKAVNFIKKTDRISYCRYALTGDLFDAKATSRGNFTMFDVDSKWTRETDESIFNRIHLKELLKCWGKHPQDDVMQVVIRMLREEVKNLFDLIQSDKVVIEFHLKSIRLDSLSVSNFIRQQSPFTINWSNVSDYFSPKEFLSIAKTSSAAEDTVHYCTSLSMTRDVKGAWIFDFPTHQQRKEVIGELESKVFKDHWNQILPGYNQHFLQPPIDDFDNFATLPSHVVWAYKWLRAFVRRSTFPLVTSDGNLQIHLYSPLSKRSVQIHFLFSYDTQISFQNA